MTVETSLPDQIVFNYGDVFITGEATAVPEPATWGMVSVLSLVPLLRRLRAKQR